ncbi:hypothetical protein HY992_04815 [Candidatus Micrarchaeota archaeon]|nr:hypothetical protein [Candidatus Micrarchaeota archaeon]
MAVAKKREAFGEGVAVQASARKREAVGEGSSSAVQAVSKKREDSRGSSSSLAQGKQFTKTVIDRMVEIVREKGRVTVEELAGIIGLERNEVEQLAGVLEESDLIAVRYSLLHPGRTELVSKETSAKGEESRESLREVMSGIGRNVDESEKAFYEIYGDLLKRLSNVEGGLLKIEREKNISIEAVDFLLEESSKLEDSLRNFDVKVDAFEKKIEAVRRKIAFIKANAMKAKKPGVGSGISAFFERIKRAFQKGKNGSRFENILSGV